MQQEMNEDIQKQYQNAERVIGTYLTDFFLLFTFKWAILNFIKE